MVFPSASVSVAGTGTFSIRYSADMVVSGSCGMGFRIDYLCAAGGPQAADTLGRLSTQHSALSTLFPSELGLGEQLAEHGLAGLEHRARVRHAQPAVCSTARDGREPLGVRESVALGDALQLLEGHVLADAA